MSQENVEILRLFYEADLDSDDVLQYLDPKVELYPGIDAPDQHMRYVGREGWSEFIAGATEAWESVVIEPKERLETRRPNSLYRPVALWREGRHRDRARAPDHLHLSKRAHSPNRRLHRQGRSPRSRRAVGVGDVGGERGDRAQGDRLRDHGVGDRAEAEAIFDPQVVLNPIDEARRPASMRCEPTWSGGRAPSTNST